MLRSSIHLLSVAIMNPSTANRYTRNATTIISIASIFVVFHNANTLIIDVRIPVITAAYPLIFVPLLIRKKLLPKSFS